MTPRRRSSSRGFTLLELLIALAITGAAVALVFATYSVIGRTEHKVQIALARAEKMQAAHNWLHRKLEGLRMLNRLENGAVLQFFNGNPAGALWVAPLPERGPSGGLHVIRVALEPRLDGQIDWVAQALPYDGALTQLDWSNALRVPLAIGLQTMQWHYQDGKTGAWVQEWPSTRERYPSRIRVEVADISGPWPPLIFTLPRAR